MLVTALLTEDQVRAIRSSAWYWRSIVSTRVILVGFLIMGCLAIGLRAGASKAILTLIALPTGLIIAVSMMVGLISQIGSGAEYIRLLGWPGRPSRGLAYLVMKVRDICSLRTARNPDR